MLRRHMYSFKKKIKSCTSINFLAYIHMYIGEKKDMWGCHYRKNVTMETAESF